MRHKQVSETMKKELDEIKEIKKLGLSPKFDLSSIEAYLESTEESNSDEDEIDTRAFFENEDTNMTSKFKTMRSLNLIRAAENLELISRELSFNIARNPERSKSSMMFFVRKIKNKPIYVMIRTTKKDEEKPVFFSVCFKGTPYAPGIYEECFHMQSNWHCTNFVSSDQHRISHLLNLDNQLTSLWSLLTDTFVGIKPNNSSDEFFNEEVMRTLKFTSMVLIEDKEDTSTFMQTYRYFLMKHYSCDRSANLQLHDLIEKYPDVVRSPICLYIAKSINDSLLNYDPVTMRKINELYDPLKASDDSDEIEIAIDTLPSFKTPFGFSVTNSDRFLLASYLCMLHNKDEGDSYFGGLECMSKMLKMEYILLDKLKSEKWKPETRNPKGFFEFDPHVIANGVSLMKKSMLERGTLSSNGRVTDTILGELAGVSIESMATTKSTTTQILDEDVRDMDYFDVKKQLTKRNRCFLMIYSLIGTIFQHLMLHNCIGDLTKKVSEVGHIIVSIFRKNQIGGTREISILDIVSRAYVLILESIARGLCESLEEECLTNPEGKKRFLSDHSKKIKKLGLDVRDGVTIKISGDMTTWCQCFIMKMFACMYSMLLPESYWNLIINVLSLMSRKKVCMTDGLFKNFMTKRHLGMSDEVLNRAKEDFHEGGNMFEAGNPTFFLMGNMLQGILHYTSSLYHICLLHVFKEEVESQFSKAGFKTVISFQASSDDEGIIITVFSNTTRVDTKEGIRALKRIAFELRATKTRVDKCFGVKTSWSKTTISLSPIYEFNSIFYFGNNICNPLIKFVARACDDHPEDNLHKRVSNYVTALSSLREAGASGSLCSLVSYSQHFSMLRGIGHKTQTWFESSIFDAIYGSRITVFGYYPITSPIESGLLDNLLINYNSLNKPNSMKSAHFVKSFQLFSSSDLVENEILLNNFNLWPTKKFDSRLEEVDLVRRDMTKLDIFLLLQPIKDVFELKQKMEILFTRKSVSRSFSFLNRCDISRTTPYYYWTGTTSSDIMEERASLIDLWSNETRIQDPEPVKNLFVNSEYYKIAVSSMNSKRQPIRIRENRKKITNLYSYKPRDTSLINSSRIIANMWFEERRSASENRTTLLFNRLKNVIPWLKDTIDLTISNEFFSGSYDTLYGAIMNLTIKNTSRKYFCIKSNRDTRAIESLPEYNTYRKVRMIESSSENKEDNEEEHDRIITSLRKIGRLACLIKDLPKGMLTEIEGFVTQKLKNDRNLSEPNWENKTKKFNEYRSVVSMLKDDEIDLLKLKTHMMNTNQEIWLRPQTQNKGVGIMIKYNKLSEWCKYKYDNEQLTEIRYSGSNPGTMRADLITRDLNLEQEIDVRLTGLVGEISARSYRFRIKLTKKGKSIDSQWTEVKTKKQKKKEKEEDSEYYLGPHVPMESSYRLKDPERSTNKKQSFLGGFLSFQRYTLQDVLVAHESLSGSSDGRLAEAIICAAMKETSAMITREEKRDKKLSQVEDIKEKVQVFEMNEDFFSKIDQYNMDFLSDASCEDSDDDEVSSGDEADEVSSSDDATESSDEDSSYSTDTSYSRGSSSYEHNDFFADVFCTHDDLLMMESSDEVKNETSVRDVQMCSWVNELVAMIKSRVMISFSDDSMNDLFNELVSHFRVTRVFALTDLLEI